MNAFTDGVIAILITILVLELRPPEGDRLSDILDEKGHLLAYVLSFVMVAIYWVNHHHLMQVVHRIDGRALWANIHLLFWLSLTPLTTAWLGQSGVEAGPKIHSLPVPSATTARASSRSSSTASRSSSRGSFRGSRLRWS